MKTLKEQLNRINELASCFTLVGGTQGRLLQSLLCIHYLGSASRVKMAEQLGVDPNALPLARWDGVYMDKYWQEVKVNNGSRRGRTKVYQYTLTDQGSELLTKAEKLGIIELPRAAA